jgi:hypothetical protein
VPTLIVMYIDIYMYKLLYVLIYNKAVKSMRVIQRKYKVILIYHRDILICKIVKVKIKKGTFI